MIPHARSAEHYARVQRERIPGESFTNAIARIAVEDAIAAFGSAKKAAPFLGITPQGAAYFVKKSRERRINADLGHPELNRRGPKKDSEWTDR
jgi:hypothetical protein